MFLKVLRNWLHIVSSYCSSKIEDKFGCGQRVSNLDLSLLKRKPVGLRFLEMESHSATN